MKCDILSPQVVAKLGCLPVSVMKLSTRPANALTRAGFRRFDQLWNATPRTLLQLANFGSGFLHEVVLRLAELSADEPSPAILTAPARPGGHRPLLADPSDLEPLTLRREWQLFARVASCPSELDAMELAVLSLPSETVAEISSLGVGHLGSLLDLRHADLCAALGFDATAGVIAALEEHGAAWASSAPLARSSILSDQQRASHLAVRWAQTPVEDLQMGGAAARALRRAGITTLSGVLAALEPLHAELALDPEAFIQVWTRLQALELRHEAWDAVGERLSQEAHSRVTMDHIVTSWRSDMQPGKWEVLSRRLNLSAVPDDGRPRQHTLYELAEAHGLSAERIRQIELAFIRRLKSHEREGYFPALEFTLASIMDQAGGVMALPQLVHELTAWINPGHVHAPGLALLVLSNSSRFVALRKHSVYALATSPHRWYLEIIKTADRLARLSYRELSLAEIAQAVLSELQSHPAPEHDFSEVASVEPPTAEFVMTCLTASGRQLPGRIPVDPTIALVRLLREIGGPAHFRNITRQLNERGWSGRSLSVSYVHNQLLHDRENFVHVSAGTYGLAEWGLTDQRTDRSGEPIVDLIVKFFESRGAPANTEEVVAYVLARKGCRDLSVLQRLSTDSAFLRFAKNLYGLSRWRDNSAR